MKFSTDIINEIEKIVGQRNYSIDPGVLETYRCIPAQSSAHYGPTCQKTPRAQAVVLPGTTEEVSELIKLCNKHKIHFKASTTFWSAQGYTDSDYAMQMDMCRMDKIQIDAKNRIAIIEPYAIGATIQAEAMKNGLNLALPGVGCSSSVLANSVGWAGSGPSSIFTGSASENLMNVEWVMPDGEILRTGSAGSGDGWFCGEGPGVSTRGILRGPVGTQGSIGICTKISIRLHPWPGPAYIPTSGLAPAYRAELPENFRCYTICFPSWEALVDAALLLHKNDILYLGHRQFNLFGRNMKAAMIHILNDPDLQLCDIPMIMEDPYIKEQNEKMKIEYNVILAGMTDKDMVYKEKVLDKIMSLTGAWKSEMMLKPEFENWALLYLLRLGHKNLNYVYCGGYEGFFGINTFVSAKYVEEAAKVKEEWNKKYNHMVDNGSETGIGAISTIGGGVLGHWESFMHFDPYDKESVKGCDSFIDTTQGWLKEKGLGRDFGRMNSHARKADGTSYTQEEQNANYANIPEQQQRLFNYQYKIKMAVHSADLSGSFYQTLDLDAIK